MTGLAASLLAIPCHSHKDANITPSNFPAHLGRQGAWALPSVAATAPWNTTTWVSRGTKCSPSEPVPQVCTQVGSVSLEPTTIAHASKPEDLTCGSVPAAVTQEADAPTPHCGQDGLRTGAGPRSAPSHCTLSSPEALGRSAAGAAVLGRPGRSTQWPGSRALVPPHPSHPLARLHAGMRGSFPFCTRVAGSAPGRCLLPSCCFRLYCPW